MATLRQILDKRTTIDLQAYGTPEGVEKGWDSRGRGRKKNPDNVKLRDMEKPNVLGYDLDRKNLTPIRQAIDLTRKDDYGADPMGDGKFKMVPSGDIVDFSERNKRLGKK